MIKLKPAPASIRLDLPGGATLTLRPLTSAIFAAAQADPLVEAARDEGREGLAVALAKAVADIAVLSWDGIGDADGNPVDPSPEAIHALLDLWPIYRAFNDEYLGPYLLLRDEGNGSAPLPTGTSAGAADTARPALNPAPTAPVA
ncbi:hypothetical protein NX862_18825 [Rhodobacter sp. KR11]|uniref:hypothetical protein n=1 Tax=Rhodobacter sp. KR11 TaxID=2974588 RepID=UPI002221B924|nr:hypothetical protein [Rhodobacter sp. KR11]MCW1920817.1 hypothetical protein [Rhodobacter sp. KR11]